MNNKEKFLKLVSGSDDEYLEMLKWNIDNEPWLKRSQAIAFRILIRLKELNISQKDLAERIGVSPQQVNKWVKGKENLSLETISKLEKALDFELIQVTPKLKEIEMPVLINTNRTNNQFIKNQSHKFQNVYFGDNEKFQDKAESEYNLAS